MSDDALVVSWYTQTTATLAAIVQALGQLQQGVTELLAVLPAPQSDVNVTVSADPALMAVIDQLLGNARPGAAVAAYISVTHKEKPMPVVINVDTTNEVADVAFVDDKGEATAAPAGMTAVWSSDNPAVLTVADDPAVPLRADLTPVLAGAANVSLALTDSGGNTPPLGPDGVTPWAVPAPVALQVDPGAAVGDRIVTSPA